MMPLPPKKVQLAFPRLAASAFSGGTYSEEAITKHWPSRAWAREATSITLRLLRPVGNSGQPGQEAQWICSPWPMRAYFKSGCRCS